VGRDHEAEGAIGVERRVVMLTGGVMRSGVCSMGVFQGVRSGVREGLGKPK